MLHQHFQSLDTARVGGKQDGPVAEVRGRFAGIQALVQQVARHGRPAAQARVVQSVQPVRVVFRFEVKAMVLQPLHQLHVPKLTGQQQRRRPEGKQEERGKKERRKGRKARLYVKVLFGSSLSPQFSFFFRFFSLSFYMPPYPYLLRSVRLRPRSSSHCMTQTLPPMAARRMAPWSSLSFSSNLWPRALSHSSTSALPSSTANTRRTRRRKRRSRRRRRRKVEGHEINEQKIPVGQSLPAFNAAVQPAVLVSVSEPPPFSSSHSSRSAGPP